MRPRGGEPFLAGSLTANPATQTPDIILSRGLAEISMASYGSLIAAAGGIRLESCQNTTFLNAEIQGRDRGGSRSIHVPTLLLERPPAHPLSAKIEVLGVVSPPPAPPAAAGVGRGAFLPDRLGRGNLNFTGIVFRLDGRRHVAAVGEPIVDDAGQPVETLRGWQLAFASEKVAIFRNGESDAVVPIEGK